MQPLPRVPGYELIQALGGGPLTCVYAARDLADDARCAVKLLRDEWADDPTAVKLLRREARAGLAVRHPHLVRVRDAHVTAPPYFLVMDLLPGESLRQRLQRDYAVDLATAVWVARQTAAALAALHRAGFAHGDVKPENVRLVDPGTAVLIDLGFAHRPGENAALLEQGAIVGTPSYLAPELCAFDPAADERADLFSLGVTVFEMLTGRLPYPPAPVAETLLLHVDRPADSLRDEPGDWPPSLVRLLTRLLARRPADRPRAAAAVQELIGLEIASLRRRSA